MIRYSNSLRGARDLYHLHFLHLLLGVLLKEFLRHHVYDWRKYPFARLAHLRPYIINKQIIIKINRIVIFICKIFNNLLTCQLTSKNFFKPVFGSSIRTNAYIIFPLFKSSHNSATPPSPLATSFKSFVWPSYPNKALFKENNKST